MCDCPLRSVVFLSASLLVSLPLPPHRFYPHRLQSLKFHLVSQFSTSYYDACVLRSSFLWSLSRTIILSCFLFVRSLFHTLHHRTSCRLRQIPPASSAISQQLL